MYPDLDEVYHFYLCDPVTMVQLHPDGTGKMITLGADIMAGQVVQCVVPEFVWQGAALVKGGRYALMGTTMAPAFDLADFELGDRATLLEEYRDYTNLILQLTNP